MPVKVNLQSSASGQLLHDEEYDYEIDGGRVLAVVNPQKTYGVFKSVSFTVRATQIIADPGAVGSIELTDMIITFEKKANSVILVQFNDGTRTAPITRITLTDAPAALSINFNGKFRGWKSAWVEAVESGADAVGTIALGYIKLMEYGTLEYADWNGRR